MQSTWNSWPQGRLITWLTPSTYSSRHTTHSTCRPIYFLHSAEKPPAPFSCSLLPCREDVRGGVGTADVGVKRLLSLSGTPVVVRDLGRDRRGGFCWSRGVVGDVLDGDGCRGDGLMDAATVWYVRTGSCSTTDFGALHLLLRILARRMRSA